MKGLALDPADGSCHRHGNSHVYMYRGYMRGWLLCLVVVRQYSVLLDHCAAVGCWRY